MKRLAFVLLFVAGSCSGIFEDREDCPSRIWFDLVEDRGLLHDERIAYVVQNVSGVREAAGETILEDMDRDHEISIRKGLVRAFGAVGAGTLWSADGLYRIPEGDECGELYRFLSDVEVREEICRIPVRLEKEFCTIDICLHFATDGPAAPYSVGIRSGWCGCSLSEVRALEGNFNVRAREDGEGHFLCRVPRQGDDGMMMDLYPKDGPAEGEPSESIRIGRIISGLEGFSWEDESLQDISLEFDFTKGLVTISVNGWDVVRKFNVTI